MPGLALGTWPPQDFAIVSQQEAMAWTDRESLGLESPVVLGFPGASFQPSYEVPGLPERKKVILGTPRSFLGGPRPNQQSECVLVVQSLMVGVCMSHQATKVGFVAQYVCSNRKA
jgi:hypothetical protein